MTKTRVLLALGGRVLVVVGGQGRCQVCSHGHSLQCSAAPRTVPASPPISTYIITQLPPSSIFFCNPFHSPLHRSPKTSQDHNIYRLKAHPQASSQTSKNSTCLSPHRKFTLAIIAYQTYCCSTHVLFLQSVAILNSLC